MQTLILPSLERITLAKRRQEEPCKFTTDSERWRVHTEENTELQSYTDLTYILYLPSSSSVTLGCSFFICKMG